MDEAERIWRSKSDQDVLEAGTRLDEFTEEGERIIRGELQFRNLPEPSPTHRRAEATEAAKTRTKKASPDAVVSHWSTLIENLQASPLAFYQSLEQALKRRQIPDTVNTRVEYRESGALSARREYLHVTRERLVFDICAAPFGTGFFVSWWLAEPPPSLSAFVKVCILFALFGLPYVAIDNLGFLRGSLLTIGAVPLLLGLAKAILTDSEVSPDILMDVPLIGWLYTWLFRPWTYYRIDTTIMFQTAVHQAVQEVIDELTKAKGLRMLSESERKPIMREFYGRKAMG